MNLTPESIQENYQRVLDRVAIAQSQAHYPHPVEIIVVSKGQPSEVIQMAYQVGIRKFGENYPDETLRKIPDLSTLFNLEWHMIGHLQSRKVPIVSQYFHAMHSIDRVEIARKISNYMMENGKTMMALLEMNVSGEESKYGFPAHDPEHWETLIPIIDEIIDLPGISVQGLMTMPPFFDDPEKARPYFVRLMKVRDYLAGRFQTIDWHRISMGTSVDFEIAIQEGATMVRIGQAILGPRPVRQ